MVDSPRIGEPFGAYRIVRRIGHGGMGTVYEAVQESLGRPVALKVLLPQFSDDEDFRSRFAREARALAALDSPHVIQVHDYGEVSGQLFIATQLVKGPDLQRRLSEHGTPPVETALDVVAQVASGLADAHAAGVLHRDIKPSNVLIREGQGGLHAYLCDLGIARTEGDEHTLTTGVAGTVGYMAPERHQGANASVQSDIYSLGCLLWVLVSGEVPFAGSSGVQLALAHMQQPVPQLATADRVSDAVNSILRRAMDKQPERRYGSAIDMRRDLLATVALADTPGRGAASATTLRPVANPTELRGVAPMLPEPRDVRAARRRRGSLLVAAAVALVAVVGGAGVVLAGGDEAADATPRTKAAAGPSPTAAASANPPARAKKATGQAAGPPRATTAPTGSPTAGEPASEEPAPTGEDHPSVPSGPEEASTREGGTAPPAPAPAVTCWNGAAAPTRQACGLPSGYDGLRTVFPSMDACRSIPSTVAGKAEVYLCGYGDFLIRYTRWAQGFDRYGYLDSSNGVAGAKWFADGEFAGRQWTSIEPDPAEREPYQWSASYRYYPYSVSVEGTSAAARERGLALVRAAAPSRIGLP